MEEGGGVYGTTQNLQDQVHRGPKAQVRGWIKTSCGNCLRLLKKKFIHFALIGLALILLLLYSGSHLGTSDWSIGKMEKLPSHGGLRLSPNASGVNDSCTSKCSSRYWSKSENQPMTRSSSTCSDEKALYGRQNVVTFSYFNRGGKDAQSTARFYLEGMQKNVVAIRKYYPGFVMRIYTDAPLNGSFCEIVCQNPDVQWCDIKRTPRFGDLSKMYFRTWRFLTLGDPTVKIFLSRDLDSVISDREFRAVWEWIEMSSKAIHVMRDHQLHDDSFLAGMWGANNALIPESLGEQFQADIINASSVDTRPQLQRKKNLDQTMLHGVLWPQTKHLILAHDSYFCKSYGNETAWRPFPTRRMNNETDFVGNKGFGTAKYPLTECPLECRPSYGKSWNRC